LKNFWMIIISKFAPHKNYEIAASEFKREWLVLVSF
jgi:hypothetical protein